MRRQEIGAATGRARAASPARHAVPLRALIAVVLCAMCGCVPAPSETPERWSRPGTNYVDFLQTRYFCVQSARYPAPADFWAMSNAVVQADIYIPCMAARGYQLDPFGPFTPLPGAGVQIL
jgi:hypothetical protein